MAAPMPGDLVLGLEGQHVEVLVLGELVQDVRRGRMGSYPTRPGRSRSWPATTAIGSAVLPEICR